MITSASNTKRLAWYFCLAVFAVGIPVVTWWSDPAKATRPQPQATGNVEVGVTMQSSNGQFVYSYQIFNNTNQRLAAFRIGSNLDQMLLVTQPTGWDFFAGLAPGTTTSPAGWTATLITQSASGFTTLEWSTDDASDTSGLQPGQSASGFSVVLAQVDNTYQFSSFTVDLGDGTMMAGPLTQVTSNPTPTPTPSPTPTPCNPSPILIQRCENNGGSWDWETCTCN